MKKLILIALTLICSANLFAQTKSQQVWATKELRSDGYILLNNGDTLLVNSPIDGEVIKRIGGVWVNAADGGSTTSVDTVYSIADNQFPVEYLYYKTGSDSVLITTIQKSDYLNGGYVTWTGNLNFTISAAAYSIGGDNYTSPTTNVTLSAADATYDRFDVFALNDQGEAIVIEGTPAANPQKPSIDPATQRELTYVMIQAGATTPSNPGTGTTVTSELVYDENVEWTSTVSGTSADFSSTTYAYMNSISANVNTMTNGDYVSFVNSESLNVEDVDLLSFFIKLKDQATNRIYLTATFLDNGVKVSTVERLGWDYNSTDWQNISLNIGDVGFTSGQFDEVRIQIVVLAHTLPSITGLYMDYVQLQGNFTQPTTSTGSEVTGNEAVFDGWDKDVTDDFDGDYNSLINQPTIPTALSELTDDATHRLVTDSEKATWDAKLSAEVDGSVTNELQTIDVAQLTGTVLELSLSSDGEATKQIELASLQDGTGTDDQTASEVPITDTGDYFTGTDVETALQELGADIASGGDGWGSDVVNHNTTLTGDGTSGSPLGVNSITATQVSDFDTEVANNTAVAANTAKVSNATHTGEVAGDVALTISSDVVDYDNVATTLKGAATDNDGAWDFSANGIINAAFSTNTTVTFSNLQLRKDIWIKLTITSSATVTWPAYCDVDGDAIDADATYRIYVACWNATVSSEDVHVSITKIQ